MLKNKTVSTCTERNGLIRRALLLLFIPIFTLSFGQPVKLVILHTNDTHSQVEPTHNNMGGYARRMGVIEKIRAVEKNVLLVDAGDFSQGTAYYNFFNGRVEIDALNRMKYDAVTIGNHEFDNGLDTLATILENNTIPLISSNYNFQNTPLAGKVKPYLVVEKGGLRIGIFGLGVNPAGLIFERFYRGMVYSDPIVCADSISKILKDKMKCDLVVCLSHLGVDAEKNDITDYHIARSSEHIDVIIGGHSHHILTQHSENNRLGKPVIIAQMGRTGEYLGRIDLTVERKKIRK
jgi:5'-nucleotidase